MNPVHILIDYFLQAHYYYSPIYGQVYQVVSSLHVYKIIFCIYLSHPCVIHTPIIYSRTLLPQFFSHKEVQMIKILTIQKNTPPKKFLYLLVAIMNHDFMKLIIWAKLSKDEETPSHLKTIFWSKALVTQLTFPWFCGVYRPQASAQLWRSQLTMSWHMFNQLFFAREFLQRRGKTYIPIKQIS